MRIGTIPLFDPTSGITVREPPGNGPSYWAGACSVIYDDEMDRFYLYYRLRCPRGMDLDRGYECRIAQSKDGIAFSDIWSALKTDFDSPSLERAALVKTLEGKYRLYIGFVDPLSNRWRIDMMEAVTPEEFKPSKRAKILTAEDISAEGVKDPYVLIVGRKYFMIVSYAPMPSEVSDERRVQMHATGDVYNTGITKSHTGLALSSDGINFTWAGDILSPGSGWDAYAARISTVIYIPPVFNVFYDGSQSVEENYEEKTGLALSFDLRHYERVSESGPILVSPYASKSLRYLDAIKVQDTIYFYYEYARVDGSHELRMSKVELV